MRAVVMAGGEGTRLRPMTANQPKPLLPVVNRPIMEHVLRLCRRHGLTDVVVTVQYLAAAIRGYFDTGEDLDMSLVYATEDRPLGTAGSVKNAQEALRSEPFVVISGDALTDIDLTALIDFHRSNDALVTVALKRVSNPLDFGIVITDDDGRILRFLEKPSWGQVFSDTVNTGIYVMEPEVLDRVRSGVATDWSSQVFPRLLSEGERLFGYIFDGYWEDVGTHASYVRAQADVLNRQVDVDIDGFEVSPGIWLAEGAEVSPDAVLKGPLYLGRNARVEEGVQLREFTVLGDNVVVNSNAFLHRSVVLSNGYIGPNAHLRGCVVGDNATVLRAAHLEEGVVVGDDCVIEEEAFLCAGVRVYPSKTIEAGARVNTNVVWESRGTKAIFGRHGVSGLANVEVTPELVVRLCSAYAATLPKGGTVSTARDSSPMSLAYQRAAVAALNTSGLDVVDLDVMPAPVARFLTAAEDVDGGILLRSSAGDPRGIDLMFLDQAGADVTPVEARRIERMLSRGEFRRAFPGDIGVVTPLSRGAEHYTAALLSRVDVGAVREVRPKIVVDTSGGTTARVLPDLLGRLGVDVLMVNVGVDERAVLRRDGARDEGLTVLGEMVASSRAAFGVRLDRLGERLSLVDERGETVGDGRALLVLLDLVAAEGPGRTIALPVTTTRVAEQVVRFHGADIRWTGTGLGALTSAMDTSNVVFGGDGRGGYVVPEVGGAVDGLAALVRLIGLVARTRLSLSEIDARIPAAFVLHQAISLPWAAKGTVMRAATTAAGDGKVDTTDGIRVLFGDRDWALVVPDEDEPVVHVWAEGPSAAAARARLDTWTDIVQDAVR